MVRSLFRKVFLLLIVSLTAPWVGLVHLAWAQSSPNAAPRYQQTYDRLLGQIRSIPIYDNHAHTGFAEDSNIDAMISPPEHLPLRLREDNPELVAASKALFGYPYDDNAPEHLKWLAAKKAELRKKFSGTQYFDEILARLNVETVMANRVELGDYLDPQHFRWVFFVDSVLFPFDNSNYAARTPDLKVYVPLQEQKLHRELLQMGLNKIPATLPEYLAFITRLVEDNQRRGGAAIKFEISYFHGLYFGDPSEESVAAIYRQYQAGGKPSAKDYDSLQDFLFRYLLREAARLKLPVQIHTAIGIGDYFDVSRGNVLNLENILRDPRYDNVTFVLLHGGYPFQDQAIWLTARQNVFLDSSLMGLFLYPDEFSKVLRRWLLLYPEKICFGSDSFPFNEAVGAEESGWLAVQTARTALAAALTEMVLHGEITEPQALKFAHGYLHDNAAGIYSKPTHRSNYSELQPEKK